MKKLLLSLLLLLPLSAAVAQTSLSLHYKDGSRADVPLADVDSITFTPTAADPSGQATLAGSWLWGSRERGYYELLTFNADYTYTGYDRYLDYGFDTQTFGFYSTYGTLLTLWSNGFGYQWRYQWFVTALTANALSVVTRSGPFTYYRLQPGVIRLSLSAQPLSLGQGVTLLFTDGVTVTATGDGRLRPLATGTTYIIHRTEATNTAWAAMVVVE
jgi:hypothetical protein